MNKKQLFKIIKTIIMILNLVILFPITANDPHIDTTTYNNLIIYFILDMIYLIVYLIHVTKQGEMYKIIPLIHVAKIFFIIGSFLYLIPLSKKPTISILFFWYIISLNLLFYLFYFIYGCMTISCIIGPETNNNIDNDDITNERRPLNIQSDNYRSSKYEQYYGDVNCTICLEEFKRDQETIILDCKHFFHKNCITPWLEKNKKHGCPLCRSIV